MTKIVSVPGVGKFKVPDNATDAQITYFTNKIKEAGSSQAAAKALKESQPGAFSSGLSGAGQQLQIAAGKAAQGLGLEGLSKSLYEGAEQSGIEAGRYVTQVPTYRDIGGIGDLGTYIAEQFASSLPITAAGIGGGIAGGLAGGPVGGITAATASVYPFLVGANLQRQAEEQNIPIEKTSGTRAAAAAAVQAPLEAVVDRYFGGAIGKTLTGLSRSTVRSSFGNELVKSAIKGAGAEGLSESGQQAIEIGQANPEKLFKMEPAVQEELLNAAVAGGLLGGAMGGTFEGVGAGFQARSVNREVDNGVKAIRAKAPQGDLMVEPIVIGAGTKSERKLFAVKDATGKTLQTFTRKDVAEEAIRKHGDLASVLPITPPPAPPPAGPAPAAPTGVVTPVVPTAPAGISPGPAPAPGVAPEPVAAPPVVEPTPTPEPAPAPEPVAPAPIEPAPAPAPEPGPITTPEPPNLPTPEPIAPAPEPEPAPIAPKPKKPSDKPLSGWDAAYRLAEVAKVNGIDLSRLSRTDYADFAVDNGVHLGDEQLRNAPKYRMASSVNELLQQRRGDAQNRFANEAESLDFFQRMNRFPTVDTGTGIRASSRNKNSSSWFHFYVNNGTGNKADTITHKGYIGFDNPAKSMTADRMLGFMSELQRAGYNGQVKTVQDTVGQGAISDQVVMHGATEEDVNLAQRVADQFFGDEATFRDTGYDKPGKSYSQWLAEDIKNGIRQADKAKQTAPVTKPTVTTVPVAAPAPKPPAVPAAKKPAQAPTKPPVVTPFNRASADTPAMKVALNKSSWVYVRNKSTPSNPLPSWFNEVQSVLDDFAVSFGYKENLAPGNTFKVKKYPGLYVGKNNGSINGTAFPTGIIVLRDGFSREKAIAVAIHEFGHNLMWEKYTNADAATKKSIQDAHRNFLSSTAGKGKTSAQLKPVTAYGSPGYNDPVSTGGKAFSDYMHNFDEWFAEQVSRWLTEKKQPVTLAEKFFKGISELWKQIYQKATGYVELDMTVRDFLDGQWRSDIAQQLGAGKPEAAATAVSPSAEAAIEEATIIRPKKDKVADKLKATEPSAVGMFSDVAVADASVMRPKSREKLIDMNISDFLNLAEEGKITEKQAAVNSVIKSGSKLSSLPRLYIENDGNSARVINHDGRHRARALLELGYETMPVIIKINNGSGPSIRWSEQMSPKSPDFVSIWPSRLIGQDNSFEVDFPVSREEATSDYTGAKKEADLVLKERAPTKEEYNQELLEHADDKPAPGGTAPQYPYNVTVVPTTQADYAARSGELSYGVGAERIARVLKFIADTPLINRLLPAKIKSNTSRAATEFIMRFADKFLSVGQFVDAIRKAGGTVLDAFDPYLREELMHGIINERLIANEANLYTPLIKKLKESGISVEDMDMYLYALHATERNIRIANMGNPDPEKGSGMTDEDADKIIASVRADPKFKDYEEARAMFRKIIDDTNKARVEAGLIPVDMPMKKITTEDGTEIDVEPYKNYAPLRGIAEEDSEDGQDTFARTGQGLNIRGREDNRALGRKSRASDIIAHAMLQNTEAIIRAEKNSVGKSLYDLVVNNKDVAKSLGVEIMTTKPLKAYLGPGGVIKVMGDPFYKTKSDVFVFKKDGKEIAIKIGNEQMARALISKPLGSPDISQKLVRAMAKMNRWFANVNTGWNPEFMLTNLPRDLQTALINIGQYDIKGIEKKVFADVRKGIKASWRVIRDQSAEGEMEDWFRDFAANGGMTAGISGTKSLEERVKIISDLTKDDTGSNSERAMKTAKAVIKLLEDANGAVENSIRLSVYKNLVEAGVSKQRAAQAAKNLTVNFDKRGEYGAVLNSLYLFFNASIQGTLSMGMALARSSKVRKTVGKIVILGMMQDIINSLLAPEGEDGESMYDKIPDYKLKTNLIIMDPTGATKSGYFAIPLPYGFNAFFNMGRTLGRSARGKYNAGEATGSIMGTFADAFNPVGGTETFLNFLAPTALDPVVALATNTDFSGKKIFPTAFGGATPKSDSQVYWSSTSPAFVSVANFMSKVTGGGEYIPGVVELKPDVLEYVFDYALGGVGSFAKRTFDTATNTIPAALTGDLQNIEVNNIPVFRRLVGNVSERVGTEQYMDQVNHVLSRGKELEEAVKNGDSDSIRSIRSSYKDELRIYDQVRTASNSRNRLATDLKRLRENEKIPTAQKLVRSDQIQKQMERLTKQVNELYAKNIGNNWNVF